MQAAGWKTKFCSDGFRMFYPLCDLRQSLLIISCICSACLDSLGSFTIISPRVFLLHGGG
jgi:hypothetical protein